MSTDADILLGRDPSQGDYADPLPVTYTVDGLTFGGYDDHGCWWVPQDTEGWHESADPRNSSIDRPNGHGSFSTPTYFDQREIVISGVVVCPDVYARLGAETTYNALCTDPGRLYEFLAVDQAGQRRTARVKRGARPKFKVKGERLAEYQITLLAPDPRKHDAAWQDPTCNPPQNSGAGLDFGTDGLNFTAPGLDFGAPASLSQAAQVGNYGTAPAYPLFTLRGPLSSPSIVHLESGRTVSYLAEVADGETVTINCDDVEQRDLRGHSVISSLRGNVAALSTRGGSLDWPVVLPQTGGQFALRSYGSTTASLTVSLRSAWW